MSKHELDNGVGIVSILGLIFVVLKLTGTIKWSWWWVTAPFWIPAAFVLLLVVLTVILLPFRNRKK